MNRPTFQELINGTGELPLELLADKKYAWSLSEQMQLFLLKEKEKHPSKEEAASQDWSQTGHIPSPLTEEQAVRLAALIHAVPVVPRMNMWAALNTLVQVLFQVHPFVEELMVTTAKTSLQTNQERQDGKTVQVSNPNFDPELYAFMARDKTTQATWLKDHGYTE